MNRKLSRFEGTFCRLFLSSILLLSLLRQTSDAYSIEGTRFIAPDGSDFIPVGTNLNGPQYGWPSIDGRSRIGAMKDVWKFNTIRVNTRLDLDGEYPDDDNPGLSGYVEDITSLGMVAILEIHDWTGSYPDDWELDQLVSFWRRQARAYKNNSAVWFNVMNEPGEAWLNPRWKTVHRRVIKAVRDEGAENIILCDGSAWGQEFGNWNTEDIDTSRSAILQYGDEVKSFDGRTYQNIGFSIHNYDQLGSAGIGKLRRYLDLVADAGHAILIGEAGGYNDTTTSVGGNAGRYRRAAEWSYTVARERSLGILSWAYSGVDGFAPVGGVRLDDSPTGHTWWPYDGGQVNDPVAPTNLSWIGQLTWDYAQNPPGSTSRLKNGSFEDAANGRHWDFFGNGWVSAKVASHGDKALNLFRNGEAWGWVQQSVESIRSGERLKLTASGAAPDGGTAYVGFKSGNGYAQELSFSEEGWRTKSLWITVPDGHDWGTVYIYTPSWRTLHVDDVQLTR